MLTTPSTTSRRCHLTRPPFYVVMRRTEDPYRPWRPFLVTASPGEAEGHIEPGEDLVEAVAMPKSMVWELVLRHHVDRPFPKRKRRGRDAAAGVGSEFAPMGAPSSRGGARAMAEDLNRFLSRWSRRKAAHRRGEPAPPDMAQAVPHPAAEEPAVSSDDGLPPMDEPVDLDEVDLASLEATGDLEPYLQPGVSPELRRAAMRRLWRVNPTISTPDGLDDTYVTEDFTDGATAAGHIQPDYRVGRGMLEDAVETPEELEDTDAASIEEDPDERRS